MYLEDKPQERKQEHIYFQWKQRGWILPLYRSLLNYLRHNSQEIKNIKTHHEQNDRQISLITATQELLGKMESDKFSIDSCLEIKLQTQPIKKAAQRPDGSLDEEIVRSLAGCISYSFRPCLKKVVEYILEKRALFIEKHLIQPT